MVVGTVADMAFHKVLITTVKGKGMLIVVKDRIIAAMDIIAMGSYMEELILNNSDDYSFLLITNVNTICY